MIVGPVSGVDSEEGGWGTNNQGLVCVDEAVSCRCRRWGYAVRRLPVHRSVTGRPPVIHMLIMSDVGGRGKQEEKGQACARISVIHIC